MQSPIILLLFCALTHSAQAQNAGRLFYQTKEMRLCCGYGQDTTSRKMWYGDTTAGKVFQAVVYQQYLTHGIVYRSCLIGKGIAVLADSSDINFTPPKSSICPYQMEQFKTFSAFAKEIGLYEVPGKRWLIRTGKWPLYSSSNSTNPEIEYCDGMPPFDIKGDDWMQCGYEDEKKKHTKILFTLNEANWSALAWHY